MSFRWRTSESDDSLPYTHHPYAYALSNPVLYTDPTGKCVDCTPSTTSISTFGYDWELVRANAATIIDAAQRHARPQDGFPWKVVAALMATTIAREQRAVRKVVDFITMPFQGSNGSIGLANTRPGRVVDIIKGVYDRPIVYGMNRGTFAK